MVHGYTLLFAYYSVKIDILVESVPLMIKALKNDPLTNMKSQNRPKFTAIVIISLMYYLPNVSEMH